MRELLLWFECKSFGVRGSTLPPMAPSLLHAGKIKMVGHDSVVVVNTLGAYYC